MTTRQRIRLKEKPREGESTGPQSEETVIYYLTSADTSSLETTMARGITYATYRALRTDPTVAIARELAIAPILCGNWTVEADKGVSLEKKTFIEEQFLDIRDQVMEEVLLYGHIDFGWMGFEKVFEYKDGKLRLAKMKGLLHDLTEILVSTKNGAFKGFHQARDDNTIPLTNSMLYPFRVEGTRWYGQGLLENVRRVCARWEDADKGAARYDRKVAGSHFVVHYPRGKSMINGVETDNSAVAKSVLEALESSGSVTVPRAKVTMSGEDFEHKEWKLLILEDKGGRQPTFVDRLRYLDTLKVRAMLLPERAILEGQFGTKAEAGEHIDLAFHKMRLLDRKITRYTNWHTVDQLLEQNWGEKARGTVWLTAAPLADTALAFFKQVYSEILKSPSGFLEEFATIDTEALKRRLEIPSKTPEEIDATNPDNIRIPLPGSEPPPGPEPGEDVEGFLSRRFKMSLLTGKGNGRQS